MVYSPRVVPRSGNRSGLWLSLWAGAGSVVLTALVLGAGIAGCGSTKSGLIAYVEEGKTKADIWVIQSDGSSRRQLTHDHKSAFPAWSPDGKRIAFISVRRAGRQELFVMRSDGGGKHLLLADSSVQFSSPDWSPDGKLIVLTAFGGGESHIWAIKADGTSRRVLTRGGDRDHWPKWSPDGHSLAFTRYRGDIPQVYVLRIDRGTVRQLTSEGENVSPSWSPDGRQIAFISTRRLGRGDIYLMDPDGSHQSRLTDIAASIGDLDWSPDGERFAFAGGSESDNLYLVNADGGGLKGLIGGPGKQNWPAWRPQN
jgi:tol-pal system beta propeller repeat protein TolB